MSEKMFCFQCEQTANCLMPPREAYADCVFATGPVAYPEVVRIGEDKGFLVEKFQIPRPQRPKPIWPSCWAHRRVPSRNRRGSRCIIAMWRVLSG